MPLLRLVTLMLVLCAAANVSTLSMASASDKPNIILIMVDDFGYECIGANGCESYRTPHVDKLAATGIRFDRCYVQPLCTPTRAQLMTGQYNVRNYVEFGLLDREQTTFAHLLKSAGYATCIVGKWQLSGGFEAPGHFGFDDYCLWQLTRRPPRYANPGLEINGREYDYRDGEYGPDLVCNHALEFISANRQRPFFLYYPMILTHSPYQATPNSPDYDPTAMGEQVGRHPRHFGEMVEYTDTLVGRIVARLEELDLRERTLLIFLGDNGTGKGTPTRWNGRTIVGGKGNMDETGMRVPLIVNWPGTIPPGQVSQNLVDSTDFLPTICEAAGAAIGAELPIDGRSFLPACRGQSAPAREAIYCWYWPRPTADSRPRQFAMDQQYKLFGDGTLWQIDATQMQETELDADNPSAEAKAARQRLQAVLARYETARPPRMLAGDPPPGEVRPRQRRQAAARP
jgi:arylsulfatase A